MTNSKFLPQLAHTWVLGPVEATLSLLPWVPQVSPKDFSRCVKTFPLHEFSTHFQFTPATKHPAPSSGTFHLSAKAKKHQRSQQSTTPLKIPLLALVELGHTAE